MLSHYEVIVIGAGTMGMSAGYFLAKQGVRTLLLDSFEPPHGNGSHHGDTRIIRHAYGESRQYVPLALSAHKLWHELEEESGQALFQITGVLSVGVEGSPFIDEEIVSAQTFSLPLEVLQAEEIRKRWPGIIIPDNYVGCFEPASGVLFSEECIRAYRKLALQHGATLLDHTRVQQVDMDQQGVFVHTDKGVFSADKLIISSGAWSGKIMSELDLPLQPWRKVFAWFESDSSLFQSDVFPAFIFDLPEEHYYGFPSFRGGGVKIGRRDGGHLVDPDQVNREFGILPEDEGDVRRFLETHMPRAAGKLKRGQVCMFTNTPDLHFIIDQHPTHPHVTIAAGFSGHGFKFGSVVGEILSQLAVKGETEHDISLFSILRPALRIT